MRGDLGGCYCSSHARDSMQVSWLHTTACKGHLKKAGITVVGVALGGNGKYHLREMFSSYSVGLICSCPSLYFGISTSLEAELTEESGVQPFSRIQHTDSGKAAGTQTLELLHQ